MAKSSFVRQSSAPQFESAPDTPLSAFSQFFTTLKARVSSPEETNDRETPKKRIRVQRSHRRIQPVFADGHRIRCYNVQPSDRVHLFHGLPFQKYNQSLVSQVEFQRMIVVMELKLLLDKSKSLKAKLTEAVDLALFELVEEVLQQNFNAEFEETIGLVYAVSEILLTCEFHLGCGTQVINPFPAPQPVSTEVEAFFANINLFVKEVERLSSAQDLYVRITKHRRLRSTLGLFSSETMNLLMQYLARARFNVGEVHEEFTVQETHQNQHTKWLCKMASMTSLQEFVPGEIQLFLKGETVMDEKRPLTKDQIKERIKTGYRKGSLARNLGLAVLHEKKEQVQSQRLQTTQECIQKMLSKFSTPSKAARHQPSSELVRMDNYMSEAAQAHQNSEKQFSLRHSTLRLNPLSSSLPSSNRHSNNNKGQKEVLRALHIGLIMSSDEKRFNAIRSIILEHEQIQRAKNARLRKGSNQ